MVNYQSSRMMSQYQLGFLGTYLADIKYLLRIDKDFFVIGRQSSDKNIVFTPHTLGFKTP